MLLIQRHTSTFTLSFALNPIRRWKVWFTRWSHWWYVWSPDGATVLPVPVIYRANKFNRQCENSLLRSRDQDDLNGEVILVGLMGYTLLFVKKPE